MYKSILDEILYPHKFSVPFNLYDSTSALALSRYWINSDGSNFEIQISLPGHDNSSVKVSIEDGKLVIATHANPEKSTTLIQSESFRFALPKGCNTKAVNAQMLNGILAVQVSKEVKPPASRKIEVQVN